MSQRVQAAVSAVRAYRAQHGQWPELPSEFIEQLDLQAADIEQAVESGALRVVFPPAGPSALLEAP